MASGRGAARGWRGRRRFPAVSYRVERKLAHLEQLVGEVLDRVQRKRTTIAVRVHVPFQVLLAELLSAEIMSTPSSLPRWRSGSATNLEDEDELGLGVDDIVQADNVDVLELWMSALLFDLERRLALAHITSTSGPGPPLSPPHDVLTVLSILHRPRRLQQPHLNPPSVLPHSQPVPNPARHSPFIKLISRMAVDGVPSSASRWISFNATISDVVRDRPCRQPLLY